MKFIFGLIALVQICRGAGELIYEMGQGEIGIVVSKQGEVDFMMKVIKPNLKVVLSDDSPLLFRNVNVPSIFRIRNGFIVSYHSFSFDNYKED